MNSDPHKGGVFLSALREKNDLRKQQLITAQSTKQMQRKLTASKNKKSFFGSFLSLKSKDLGGGDTDEVDAKLVETETTKTTTVQEQNVVVITSERTHSMRALIGESPVGDEAIEVETTSVRIPSTSISKAVEAVRRSGSGKALTEALEKEGVTVTHTHHVSLGHSTEGNQPATSSTSGVEQQQEPQQQEPQQTGRPRRASTAVDKRLSQAAGSALYIRESSTDASGTRDRTHSMATMDDVYGRAGRETSRAFEMTNPLLAPEHPRRSLVNTTPNNNPVMTEQKRASLYHSAPHVDQAMLLERRNTRAGRSSSLDVHTHHVSGEEEKE